MASSSSPNTGGKDMIACQVKGGWTKEEDDVLRKLVGAHGTTSWSLISRSVPGRSNKACRLRWCNHISPDVEHRPFTVEEHCSVKRKFSPPDHGEAPKMIMPVQVRMPLPLQAPKFDSGSPYDPMTILSLALPGHRSLPGNHGADVPDQTNRPPVEPPTTSPMEVKMGLMEDKIQELSQETSAMRKPMLRGRAPALWAGAELTGWGCGMRREGGTILPLIV